MNRITFYLVLPALIGAASIVNVLAFTVNRFFSGSGLIVIDVVGLVAVLVVLGAFAVAIRGMRAGRWLRLIAALIVIVAAGFAPRLVEAYVNEQQRLADQVVGADVEMQFQSALLTRGEDIDKRAAAGTPYPPAEAMAFLEFAADADLSGRGLLDHTPEALDLVSQAIDDKVLDPNALVLPPVADTAPKTLTLAFYDKRIRPAGPARIARHDWDVLKVLVAGGADLSAADAAPLRADLARAVAPGTGPFIVLQ